MTLLDYAHAAPKTRPQARQQALGALIDVTLLFISIGTAADMMINLGEMFKATWILCYAIALMRIAAAWPFFLSALVRNKVVLAYPTICLASVVWSYAPAGSLVSALQLMMTVLIGCYLGWRYSLAIILKCFAILMTIAAALSLLHLATGVFPWPIHTGAGGLAGLFKHKTMLGQRSLFCIAVIVGLLLLRRSEPGWTPRYILVVALCLTMVTLILSKSMTSILLLLPMAGVVLVFCLHRIPAMTSLVGLGLALVGIGLGPVLLTVVGLDPVATVLDGLGKDATLTGRTVLWDIAWQTARDNPILGTGFRAFWLAPEFANGRVLTYEAGARSVASFHNFVLEILVSVGWPGLFAMLAQIAICARRLGQLYARDRLPTTAVAISILGGIVVTSMLDASLFRGHEIMILLIAAMTVTAGEDLRRPTTAEGH